jgi:hypothetical protein
VLCACGEDFMVVNVGMSKLSLEWSVRASKNKLLALFGIVCPWLQEVPAKSAGFPELQDFGFSIGVRGSRSRQQINQQTS